MANSDDDPTSQSDAARVNQQYYEAPAHGRDDYWRKMAAPRHRIDTLVAEIEAARPSTLVDLGCGNGTVLAEVHGRLPAITLTGIDLSESQIALNRDLMPEIFWHSANLDATINFGDELRGGFDAVVAAEIIEHLDDPGALLDNARALARPGRGRLYLSTQSGPVRETEQRVGHRRHFKAAEMTELLNHHGWRPLRVWNTGFPFHDLSKWYANRDPDRSMERFGGKEYGWSENLICAGLRLAFRLNSNRRGAQLFAVAARPPGKP